MARKTWPVKSELRAVINMLGEGRQKKGGFLGGMDMFVKKLK
ncbi:hypothetical protein [Acetobacter pomorum]|nr:hypothetical protein [Acetobacter pomorum]